MSQSIVIFVHDRALTGLMQPRGIDNVDKASFFLFGIGDEFCDNETANASLKFSSYFNIVG